MTERKPVPAARTLTQLQGLLDGVLIQDAQRLRKQITRAQQRLIQRQASNHLLDDIRVGIEQSAARVRSRQAAVPEIQYPPELPVAERRQDIAELIRNHQVVILGGETGSGKTTQLPKICLELGCGMRGLIGHTQPRRIAARTVAMRIAEELHTRLGDVVGYQVRFTDQTSPNNLIKLMTDGILLAEIQHDPLLLRYDTLIIDEAHERSLNIDFLLGYLKRLLPQRPDLKLIITSATIDLQRFSQHFGDAPIIEVSGRTYPVEVRYRPPEESDSDDRGQNDIETVIAAAIEELIQEEYRTQAAGGDVLVFLPGERDIRETALALRKANLAHCEVLPLYARLSQGEQARVFAPSDNSSKRRIVLATNVAETSITVPGIRYVVDTGLARISRYSYRSKIQRLPIEPISQASARQRMGRCGRVMNGICIRLYSEQDFLNRPEFTDPEILRTNLAAVILQMLSIGLGDIEAFPFLEPPDRRQINDGFKLLQELGALEQAPADQDALPHGNRITAIGRQLAKFPVDPRLGRMIVAAPQYGCLREVLIITSFLSVQDPRERPADKQQKADELHRRFQHKDSDFYTAVQLWDYYETQRQELSKNQLSKQCRKEFLSYIRMREWRDIHYQLRLAAHEMGLRENQEPAQWQEVHKALLPGLLSHIALREERKEYLGARNRRLQIFPGSGLYKAPPKWLLCAELVETSQLFARQVGSIEPEWVLPVAGHLLKREYLEPRWQGKTGQVVATEKITLYGLLISDRGTVDYGRIDPQRARQIFIQEALVAQQYRGNAAFYRANRQLLDKLAEMETKARRTDIGYDEQTLYEFYDQHLPQSVWNARMLEIWYKKAVKTQRELLLLTAEILLRGSARAVTEAQFPDFLEWQESRIALSYRFEPGHPQDGVTAVLPATVLTQIPDRLFDWLVPGMLRDKCISVLKALAKPLRRQLVPIPALVDQFLASPPDHNAPLFDRLGEFLKRERRLTLTASDWAQIDIDPHYRMNFRIVDNNGNVLAQGRDLAVLKQSLRQEIREQVVEIGRTLPEQQGLTAWNFGELAESVELAPASRQQSGLKQKLFPALVDEKDSVALRYLDDAAEARRTTRNGVIRLLRLQTRQQESYLHKDLFRGKNTALALAALLDLYGGTERLKDSVIQACYQQVFVPDDELPVTQEQFKTCLDRGRARLIDHAQQMERVLEATAVAYRESCQALEKYQGKAFAAVRSDIEQQIRELIFDDFIVVTPWQSLQQLPRYFKAITQRLHGLAGQMPRDQRLMASYAQCAAPLARLLAKYPQAIDTDPEVNRYRWLLEEYRVSLFAQQLGTAGPVSEQRLARHWRNIVRGQI